MTAAGESTEDIGLEMMAVAMEALRWSGLAKGWRVAWSVHDTPRRAVISVMPDPLPWSGLDAAFWAAMKTALDEREPVLTAAGFRVQREKHARFLIVTRMADPAVIL
jgi:hypothetical protein